MNSKFKIQNSRFNFNEGQSLVEIIIIFFVSAFLIITSSTAVVLIVRNNLLAEDNQTAGFLSQELIDSIQAIAKSDWNDVYNLLSKGPGSQYYVASSTQEIVSGIETLTVEGKDFTRYFSVENANRDACGAGDITTNATSTCVAGAGILEDPSTQKITIAVERNGNKLIDAVQYLTRYRNAVFVQTDWSGGSTASDETVILPNSRFASSSNIDFSATAGSIVLSAGQTSGNLTSSIFDTQRTNGAAFNAVLWQGDSGDGTVKFQIATRGATQCYAWNDFIGWIDFCYPAGNVTVESAQLTGYAYNDDIQEIALDCATSPIGDICSTSDFKVLHDSGTGDLSGWAWNDSIGWISFNCNDPGVCLISDYKVNVDPATGEFTGWAWNDIIGWISFNCNNSGIGDTCGTSDYKVQITSTGNWVFIGDEGSETSYYGPAGPDAPISIIPSFHNNYRYVRYKVFLTKTSNSPKIDDIIINWSP